jgi:hypothetical protein
LANCSILLTFFDDLQAVPQLANTLSGGLSLERLSATKSGGAGKLRRFLSKPLPDSAATG